jgi:negative elongation factor C/D
MMAAGIRRQRLSARDWGLKALLDEFAAAAAAVQFKPPLSAREAHFLQDISTDRPPGY